MRIFSESPLDRRDHTNRLSCHIIHEFRFSRIDFCSAARCRQRAGESGSFRRVAVQRNPRFLVLALQRLEHAHRHEQPHDVGGIRLRVEALKRVRIRLRKEARGRKRLLRPTSCPHGNLPRPLDRHGRANRALARRIILHANLRLLRVGFRPAARRRQRAGESGSFRRVAVQRNPRFLVLALQRLEHAHRHEQPHDVGGIRLRVEALKRVRIRLRKEARRRKRLLRPAPRFHGNLPRPLDCHGRAHRALARRVVLHANLRLLRVGFRPAARRRQRAGESGSFRRVAVQRNPRLLVLAFQRLEHAHRHEQPHDVGGIRLRVEALKRVRIRLRKEARGRKRLLRPTSCPHGNLPRPLDRHGRANRALARRITRIFVSRSSAFARLRAAASAPESAVGRKRAAPACGRKRLLRPAPRLHGNLPRPLDRHGRAHRALARRIVLHANLHLPRVGFRPAARRRQCARIRRRKEARHASAQAKAAPTTHFVPSR